MFWKSKLAAWESAGLISSETAEAIRVHEEETGRGKFARNMILVGVFSVILGILSIIASNWHNIPDPVKIASHIIFLNCGSGLFLYWAVSGKKGAKTLDAAILAFWGLILTLLALVGQVYNIHSDPFRTIALWTALGTPIILIYGQSRFLASMWLGALVLSFVNIVDFLDDFTSPYYSAPFFLWLLAPFLLITGNIKAFSSRRADFCNAFTDWGILLFSMTVIMAQFLWYFDGHDVAHLFIRGGHGDTLPPLFNAALIIYTLATTILAAGVLIFQDTESNRRPWILWLGSGTALSILPLTTASFILDMSPLNGIVSASLFILWCLMMAWFSLKTGIKSLADLAILLIVLRLMYIYIEVFGSMATTGIGLIILGLLFIATTVLALRIRKKVVPCAKP